MPTSQTHTLSKPSGDEKISRGTLSYILAHDRQQAYDLIIDELEKSGISQATLARRLGKGPDEISRLLKRPTNWQINTFGALLYAICGGLLRFEAAYPSDHQTHHREARSKQRNSRKIEQQEQESQDASKKKAASSKPRSALDANNAISGGAQFTPTDISGFRNEMKPELNRTEPNTLALA